MRRVVLVALLLPLLLVGCGSPGSRSREPAVGSHRDPVLSGRISLSDREATRAALLEQYLDWAGVPYRYGGNARDGMDCSGFIQLTYLQRFGIVLPRDTAGQRHAGRVVGNSRLHPGDLVFFDTSEREHHVGIYIGKGQFLHVSTRAGVMLSRLDDGYWRRRYTSAVRVGP